MNDTDTDTETIDCPIDGCDYWGESIEALRSHANARTDHDWSEVQEQLPDDALDSSQESDDGEETSTDDQPEPADDSDTDTEDMPTDSELDKQRQKALESTDTDDTDDSTDSTTSSTPPLVPVSRGMLIGVAGAVALGLLLYWYMGRDATPTPEPQHEEETQQTAGESRGGFVDA